MGTTVTAKEISEAWLVFVNEMFMTDYGCNRPSVAEEVRRLDAGGTLMQAREDGRMETDELIGEILRIPAESRTAMYSTTSSRALALVNDRVQCGTQLLTSFVQRGVKIDTGGMASMEDFFRQILLQRPEA